MHLQTVAPAVKLVYPYTVPDDVAQANLAAEAQRKADRRAAKDARRQADAERREKQLAAAKAKQSVLSEHASAEVAVTHGTNFVASASPVPETFVPRITYMPTAEEQAEFRRKKVEVTKRELFAKKKADKPTRVEFIVWITKAGFVHNRDEGKDAIYSCEGVEITVFRGALGEAAIEKTTATPKVHAPRTAEERERNRRLNEEQRAKKVAAQAAWKATHPKKPKPAKKPDGTKGKKNKK